MRLFLLGAVETTPLGCALGFGSYIEPSVPYAGTAISGLFLSVLLCWFLRDQTPPTVIHAVPRNTAEKAESHATKENAA